MNKKYILFLSIAASIFTLGGCESCKGLFSQGANSPAGLLMQKHIDFIKLSKRQAFVAEGGSPEKLDSVLAEIDKKGKDIRTSYIVKMKNACSSDEISSTDKLVACVNDAMAEALENKVADPDELIEKCKNFAVPKAQECSQVMVDFFQEFDKSKE